MSAPHPARDLLRVSGISKSFNGTKVLHDVSFSLNAGELLGIVGENGSGKSTTMNILSGVLSPDGGGMTLAGADYQPTGRRVSEAAGVGFIQQELNIFPNLSVAENLFLGRGPRIAKGWPFLSRRKRDAAARPWLDAVGLNAAPHALALSLSAGERQLLEIARALSGNPRVMIFDEPTTSLTNRETRILFDLIAQLKIQDLGIIYISHALEDVLALSERVLVLRDGRVTLDADRPGLTATTLVQAMVGRPVDTLFPERATKPEQAPPLLEVEGLGTGGVLADINLTVAPGEILGIAGLMGSGRTELARALFGADAFDTGVIRLGGKQLASGDIPARLQAGMAFLTEDRRHEGLMMDASVTDNFALAALPRFAHGAAGAINRSAVRAAVDALASKLNLKSGPLATTPVRALSGGNQQKVLLGRWMMREPRLLILDEPTRGVDVGAKEEIYRLLTAMAEAGAGVIVISSDIEEVMGLADRILVMHRGRVADRFDRSAYDRNTLLHAAFGQAQSV